MYVLCSEKFANLSASGQLNTCISHRKRENVKFLFRVQNIIGVKYTYLCTNCLKVHLKIFVVLIMIMIISGCRSGQTSTKS